MAVRSWTSHIQARIRGDVESVVSWWTSPERRAEQRARFEKFDFPNFRFEETLEDGQRIIETGWTNARGLQISMRMAAPARPHGDVERAPDGRVLLRGQSVRSREWPNGRADLSRSEFVYEFSELPDGRTRLRLTVDRYTKDVPRWERRPPPEDERRHLRMHLKDTIARCEYDLGTRKSAERRFAIY